MLNIINLPDEMHVLLPPDNGLGIRIGTHAGSVVESIVGTERLSGDAHSAAVNTIARIVQFGVTNRIHTSQEFQHYHNKRSVEN